MKLVGWIYQTVEPSPGGGILEDLSSLEKALNSCSAK